MPIAPKDYWYPWYPGRYEKRTRRLSLAEDGAYRRLIDEYMVSGEPLPDDDRELSRICAVTMEEWLKVREAVHAFFESDGMLLRNKRCDKTLAEQNQRGRKRSKAAKTAANARWQHKKGGNADGNADGMRDASETHEDRNAIAMRFDATGQDRTGHKQTHGADAPLPDLSDQRTQLYHRGKQVLGKSAGGQVTRLLAALDNSVPRARSAIETAATKTDPGEYIAAVIKHRNEEAGQQPPAAFQTL